MKSRYILSLIVFAGVLACTINQNHVSKIFVLEDPLPKDILNEYLDKASLKEIENGVDSFEIRKWYPFYYTDSFPIALVRFYYNNNKLNGEYYLFSTKNRKQILTKTDLDRLSFEKYEFKRVPIRFLDSLQSSYDLSKIDSFNLNIVREKNANPYSTRTPRNIFIEQSSAKNYYGIFITNPELYPGLNKSLDQYARFSRFISDSLCQSDTGFARWITPRINEILGIKN